MKANTKTVVEMMLNTKEKIRGEDHDIIFEEEGDVKLPLECEALAKRVVEEALDYVGCPYEAEVNLLLTENAQIHEMNKEFRGIDRATDVLSFPMIDYPEPGTFDFLEEQEDCFDPESGELTLGDIVISKEKVLAQAEEYGHSPMREICFSYCAFCVTLNRL